MRQSVQAGAAGKVSMMSSKSDRREFLLRMLALGASSAALGLAGCGPKPAPTSLVERPETAAENGPTPSPAQPEPIPSASTSGAAYLAVARGEGADPAALVGRAIAAVGGIERFVKPGANVIVKPNICNAYRGPEYASTTNPEVVGAIVALCLGAGAKRVRVMDYSFGGAPQKAYATSGIADAVKAAGGEMEVMSGMRFRKVAFPAARLIQNWEVYGDILEADTVIDVPIAKNHGGARLTLGMKNLMGLIKNRGGFHSMGLHQCIADLCTVVRPQLTVVDAVRMLMANGPTGGNLDDVKRADTVIASADIVAADAYAATLFGMKPSEVDYIRLGAEMGLGRIDLGALQVEEIAV